MITHYLIILILKLKKKLYTNKLNDTFFLDFIKIIEYKNSIYFIAPIQKIHPLTLFKDKQS